METFDQKVKYSQNIAKLEEDQQTLSFLENYGEEVIEKLKTTLENRNRWSRPQTTYEGKIYTALEDMNLLDQKGFTRMYRIEASKKELDLLEERREKYFSRNYDEEELIALAELEFEDEKITTSKLRNNSITPTEKPFETVFGSLSNLNWRLGKDYRKTYDREILIEEYLKELHERNSEYSVLIDLPNIGDNNMPTKRVYYNHFSSSEEIKKEANVKEIEEIKIDLDHWHEIIASQLSISEKNSREFIKSEILGNVNDLKPVYPRLDAKHPSVENKKKINH